MRKFQKSVRAFSFMYAFGEKRKTNGELLMMSALTNSLEAFAESFQSKLKTLCMEAIICMLSRGKARDFAGSQLVLKGVTGVGNAH